MANAHAWRHRTGRGKPCPSDCIYCKNQPKAKKYRNKNGHRHNPGKKHQ